VYADAGCGQYVGALLAMFAKLSNIETLRFVVTMLMDLVEETPSNLELLVQAAAK
jgi:hypothetical protein